MNGLFHTPLSCLILVIREAVAVFDWAMENMSIWASLDIESRNAKTLGRAYTCGVSNMGRYPFETQVTLFDLCSLLCHTTVAATAVSAYFFVHFSSCVLKTTPGAG